MAKIKNEYRQIQGKDHILEIHVNKDGIFNVKNVPEELLTTLGIVGIAASSLIDVQISITKCINEYHEALKNTRKVIIYRLIMGSACRSHLHKENIHVPEKSSGTPGTSINGYGYCLEWDVAYEINLGNKKTYRRFMVGDEWENKPMEKLPLISYIFPDQTIIDYNEDVEKFFIEFKNATLTLSENLAKVLGPSVQTFIDNINQNMISFTKFLDSDKTIDE